MNRIAFLWLIIGIGMGAILFQGELIQISEALYGVPPTRAFSIIELNDTELAQGDLISSNQYNEKLYIITDGSILLDRSINGTPP